MITMVQIPWDRWSLAAARVLDRALPWGRVQELKRTARALALRVATAERELARERAERDRWHRDAVRARDGMVSASYAVALEVLLTRALRDIRDPQVREAIQADWAAELRAAHANPPDARRRG